MQESLTLKREDLTEDWQTGMRNWFLVQRAAQLRMILCAFRSLSRFQTQAKALNIATKEFAP